MDFREGQGAWSAATGWWFALLIILIIAVGLAGCGGGGSGGNGNEAAPAPQPAPEPQPDPPPAPEPEPAPDPQVTISGHAVNDAVANGTVRLETLDGFLLGQASTDGEGAFAIQTTEADIADGYRLVVTGGQVRDRSFRGELRAKYSGTENRGAANVTLLTTLASRMAELESSGSPLQRRNLALQRMTDLGAIEPGQWNAIEPEGVALESLRVAITEQGFDDVLHALASQLRMGEFSERLLEFFPNMFGGVVALGFGDERNRISDFAGRSGTVEVEPIVTSADSHRFSLEAGPGWLTVNPNTGAITYAIPDGTSPGQLVPFSIRVINNQTGFGRSIQAAIFVMEAETLAEGSVGPEGGAVIDAWGEIVIDVEAGAASVPTQFRIIRGRNAEGNVVLSVRVDGDPDVRYRVLLPDPEVMDANTPPGLTPSMLEPQSFEDQRSLARMGAVQASSLSNPITTRLASGSAWFFEDRRLPELEGRNFSGISGEVDLTLETVYELWGPASYDPLNDPVLFVHGYTQGSGLGGGAGTWKDFPALVAAVNNRGATYTPYEFRWRTDARYQDVADDLAEALLSINGNTGRKVHVVAHSFGGIAVRTLLQRLSASDAAFEAIPIVASVTTVGTPHSGVFGARGDRTRDGITFPNGRDGLIAPCRQISCYQMGVSISDTVGWTESVYSVLGLDRNRGYIAQRLVETVGQLPNVSKQVLIGLTSSRQEVAEGGDALISYSGQRFLPHLGENSLLLSQNFSQAAVRERLLGYDELDDEVTPRIVPGVSVTDRWNSENHKRGYRHTRWGSTRGSLKQVLVECSSVIDCEHDVWLKTMGFLADVHAEEFMSTLFTVNGAVRDTAGQGIPGASVRFHADGVQLQTATTDASGNYTADLLFRPNTVYTVVAIPPGGSNFRAATATGTLTTVSSLAASGRTFPVVTLVAGDPTPGTLAGEIVDALTANRLPGAQYRVVNSIGFEVASGVTSDGRVTIQGLPPGSYRLYASAPGFRSGVNQRCSVTAAATSSCSLPLSRELATAETMRIVLSWGQDPRDLDSHLVKYNAAGQRLYRLAYYSRTDAASGDNLDVDVVNSFGPETITIQSVDPSARYVYAVHHFSGAGSLTSTSNARVTVSYGAQSDLVFNVPASGTGNWWKVFEVNEGTVSPCTANCLFNAGGAQDDIALQTLQWPSVGRGELPRWLSDMTEGSAAK